MAEITIYDVNSTLKWLESIENNARRTSQKETEQSAKLAQRVVKSLSGVS